MNVSHYTPVQRAAVAARFEAAEKLERARQVVRENQRYGYPITQQHRDLVHHADEDYDLATALAGRAVNAR